MIKSLVKNLFKDVDGEDVDDIGVNNTIEAPVEPETSPTTIKVAVLSDDQDKLKLDELEKMLKEVLSTRTRAAKKPPIPYILVTDDPEWYYDPVNRHMIRIHPGTELILSDPEPNEEGKVMCYCDLGFFMVPIEQISQLGFN